MDFPSYKGLIIFVHGMGGGHTAYMTEIHALAQEGYLVLGYDNTGTMLSDGAELGGFPQAFLDLRHAISFFAKFTSLSFVSSVPGRTFLGEPIQYVISRIFTKISRG